MRIEAADPSATSVVASAPLPLPIQAFVRQG
jgi:hypothetical protein